MAESESLQECETQRGGTRWNRINGVVLGVIGLHLFVYTATVTCVIIPWLSFSVPGIGHLTMLTALVLASLGCLLAAVVSDAGSVPEDYIPDTEGQQRRQVVEVKKKSGGARVCQKCGRGKPPRAHHCRVCRTCILRMDHHCPWLNNCVGHGNYRAFALFLLYSTAATWHALTLLAAHAFYRASAAADVVIRTGPQAKVVGLHGAELGSATTAYSVGWAGLQIAATAIAVPLALGLAGLLAWNAWLLAHNKTTIEYHEGITAQIYAQAAGARGASAHPYDLGLTGNLFAVCGTGSCAGWLLPMDPAADGPGTAFPTIWDAPGL
mmetsp:Transcript_20953/g.63084  ORF Transcript_20953/g.63084 Transcript_20953/m.63084 type:complete len:323 (+) Transcript_20953:604-1572(+)|eukprot:CAMPEP_0206141468 /NCGR_PEP_ID=MMETSP1473-20131121/13035_1 /ASSEMBLY_ACC=CAM_ASM_001109 /TAXON_ID=1461547 /ORGANISM="Stichococcus sp, Strain RCC1054" /LENGTH=322 /DNA_ID=CAMNT_0053536051 /DNA_START=500 /DNA_END=1468 /DNA_ORIENTATION=-